MALVQLWNRPFFPGATLHCSKGGYTHLRHNELWDTIAKFMNDVCDVEIEPLLQPLQGEGFDNKSTARKEEARLNIKTNGLWKHRLWVCFFGLKIFYPLETKKRQKHYMIPTNITKTKKQIPATHSGF